MLRRREDVTPYIKSFGVLIVLEYSEMPQKERVIRFSVSLPPKLVDNFDEICDRIGYESRSKAVHDALRGFITEFEWMREETKQIAGTVSVLFYLDKPGLLSEITNIQHEFRVVISTLHLHLEERKCLEVIVVKGTVNEIKELTQELMVKKGVKQVKASLIVP